MSAPAMTHSPYAILPMETPTDKPMAKQRQPPTISRPPFSHTLAVLQEVQAVGADYFASPRLGWRVLRRLWRLTPADFDADCLAHLSVQPPFVQQHVLLVLATTALRGLHNVSAFLRRLIPDVGERLPVCLGFLAGCCQRAKGCPFAHPPIVPAWQQLQERWQVGWLDFDYLVLNSLLLRPEATQDAILRHMARMKLKSVRNPSALLASIIQQFHGPTDLLTARPGGPRPTPAPAAATLPPPAPGRSATSVSAAGTVGDPVTNNTELGWYQAHNAKPALSEVSYEETVGPSDESDECALRSFLSHRPGSHRSSLSWVDQLEDPEGLPSPPRSPLDLPIPYAAAAPPSAPRSPATPATPASPASPANPAVSFATRLADPNPTPVPLPAPAPSPTVRPPPTNGRPAPRGGPVPGPGYTAQVAAVLRERAALAPPAAGWVALQALWGVGPAHFDAAALEALARRQPFEQEHILLSIAAMDLRQQPHRLAALLEVGLQTAGRPVCWRNLAGLCPATAACLFRHPSGGPAWDGLRQRGVSPLAIDYAVLNFLLQLPAPLQDRILAEADRQLPPAVAGPTGPLLRAMAQVLQPSNALPCP